MIEKHSTFKNWVSVEMTVGIPVSALRFSIYFNLDCCNLMLLTIIEAHDLYPVENYKKKRLLSTFKNLSHIHRINIKI